MCVPRLRSAVSRRLELELELRRDNKSGSLDTDNVECVTLQAQHGPIFERDLFLCVKLTILALPIGRSPLHHRVGED